MKVSRRNLIKLAASSAGLSAGIEAFASAGGTQTVNMPKPNADMQPRARDSAYKMQKLFHGAAYYPELWPESDIEREIAEMQKLGINVVRMGEFAWSVMEPVEGKISLAFFRKVMDKLHTANIDVVFCTPTATPPIWLTHKHPERLFVNENGEKLIHGARQHASYEHPAVRKACLRIVEACAKELGNHPALIAWQIDNELKAHVAEDFSEAAIQNWQRWLQKKFGTIEKLNAAWGTHIWSEYYHKFEQVPAPLKTPFLHNASLSTAYKIFARESIVEFVEAQNARIRKHSSAPITHNTNPAFSIHHERLVQDLDFISWDAYPNDKQWPTLVFRSDMYRAAKPGRPFWLMETSSSHNGWLGEHQPYHPPGFLAAEAVLTYSLGSEGFCYWLWRQQRTGCELPHSAVMSAWFKPGIGYKEVENLEVQRKILEPLLLDSEVLVPEVALTWSDHARAMIQTEPMDKRGDFPTRYRDLIEYWHSQLRKSGFHRDVRFENSELAGLKLLVTPAMPYVSEIFLARVEKFVREGGIWLAGPLTGMRGEEHTVPVEAGLGLLDAFAGVETEYVFPLTGREATGSAFNMTVPLSGWCAAVKPLSDTKVVGKLKTDVTENLAFLTERNLGKGKVVLLSAHPQGEQGEALLNKIIQHYANEAKVGLRFEKSEGVMVCPRTTSKGENLWIAVNMDKQPGQLKLPPGAVDAINGNKFTSALRLKTYEWRAIRFRT